MSSVKSLSLIVSAIIASQVGISSGAIVFSDDWNDHTVQTPTLTSGGDWQIVAGTFTADGSNPGGHTGPLDQVLNMKPVANTAIEVYFGDTVDLTPVTLTYKLRQSDIQTSNTQFQTFLIDSVSGKNVQFIGTANVNHFGSTGFGVRFDDGDAGGGIAGYAHSSTDANFHTVELVFTPNANSSLSRVYAYYDSVMVGNWLVPNGLSRVDTLRFKTNGDISYNIDDVSIDATLTAVPEPAMVSLISLGALGLLGRRRMNRR